MMPEARIGRLLAPCIHQAILDLMPQRVEFYEHWLNSESLRDGSLGLAGTTAVLGFLRTEGQRYDAIMTRAGRLAVEWTLDGMSPARRRSIMWLPRWVRARIALRLAGDVVRSICSTSRLSSRVRRGRAHVTVHGSVFCTVRERQMLPLCAFNLAVAIETLVRLGVPAQGDAIGCLAVNGGACTAVIDISGSAAAVAAGVTA
jgi:hypothetical protein